MVMIASTLMRARRTRLEVDDLKSILVFCGVGLILSLLLVCYGPD